MFFFHRCKIDGDWSTMVIPVGKDKSLYCLCIRDCAGNFPITALWTLLWLQLLPCFWYANVFVSHRFIRTLWAFLFVFFCHVEACASQFRGYAVVATTLHKLSKRNSAQATMALCSPDWNWLEYVALRYTGHTVSLRY